MIPRSLHQIWLGPQDPPEELLASWRAKHPRWRYQLWTETEIRALGVNRQFENLLDRGLWDAAADVARVEILLTEGGVYADADSRCLRTLEAAPFMLKEFFAVEEETTSYPTRLVSNAFMGAEPNHPVLVEYRKRLAGLTRFQPTWKQSGPVLLTTILADFEVEILPPWTFYDRTLQGKEIRGAHYATHRWSSTVSKPHRFSALFSFREDLAGHRAELWRFVRERFEHEHPLAEIIVGTDDSVPFNKSRAINRAASVASHDVYMIGDTDTVVCPDDITEAVNLVLLGSAKWVKPWRYKTKLNQADSAAVVKLGLEWSGEVSRQEQKRSEMRTPWWSSPPCVIPRAAYEMVNGMDERFAGWGQEDDAFGHALEALWGRRTELGRRDSVHLWHPRIGKSGYDAWDGSTLGQNRDRGRQYRSLLRDPGKMAEMVADNRSSVPA